jgi:cold-inducible RNA-binding protein
MNSKLYVGNLSYETTEADIRTAFEPFGTITEVHLASDRYTGRPRGFAFVTFASEAESKAAAEKLNGSQLDGRDLTVNEARSADGSGGGGGGGGTTRQFSSPDRRAGAFHARGKRRR